MTAQQIIADLKAEQKGKAYPRKDRMMKLLWDMKGMMTVSSFEIIPIVRYHYDKLLEVKKTESDCIEKARRKHNSSTPKLSGD